MAAKQTSCDAKALETKIRCLVYKAETREGGEGIL